MSIQSASVRLSSASALFAVHGCVGVDLRRVRDDGVERLLHLLPQLFRLLRGQLLAVENDRSFEILFGHVEELQTELLRVGDPGWMIRPDQLSAPSTFLPGTRSENEMTRAADAIARFDDGDFVSGAGQLVGGGQAAEARADDDHAARAGAERRGEALGDQQRRAGGERALEHLAAGECRWACRSDVFRMRVDV